MLSIIFRICPAIFDLLTFRRRDGFRILSAVPKLPHSLLLWCDLRPERRYDALEEVIGRPGPPLNGPIIGNSNQPLVMGGLSRKKDVVSD
jgi:hypothetical protein